MEWIKVTVRTASAQVEVLAAALAECGVQGVEIIDPREFGVFLAQDEGAWDYVDDALLQMPVTNEASVVFYLDADEAGERALAEIEERVGEILSAGGSGAGEGVTQVPEPIFQAARVNDADWLDEWKKFFVPISVGRVDIVPAWEVGVPSSARAAAASGAEGAAAERVAFILDPGSAFGTGQHATTYLCVGALQKFIHAGDVLLDVGCGSGILAVIGLLLGVERAAACDIDPSAIAATHKNAELNGIDATRLRVLQGNILADEVLRRGIAVQTYNIITANIVADVIIELLPLVPHLLKKSGKFIASGIIAERAEDVKKAADAQNALVFISEEIKDGWHCMVFEHA